MRPIKRRVECLKIAARQLLAPFRCSLIDGEREPGISVAKLFSDIDQIIAASYPKAGIGAPRDNRRRVFPNRLGSIIRARLGDPRES